MPPLIVDELAGGNLNNRSEIFALLQSLPMTATVEFDEFLFFLERHHLAGKDVGFVDVHLLAPAYPADAALWTADNRLKTAADLLGLTF
jgi:hypothetical protein